MPGGTHKAPLKAEPNNDVLQQGDQELCIGKYQGFACELDIDHDGAHTQDTVTWDDEAIGARDEDDPITATELEVLEPEQNPWNTQCHSFFAALECALPAGHENLHTADADNEDAPTWDDEAQTGQMPF